MATTAAASQHRAPARPILIYSAVVLVLLALSIGVGVAAGSQRWTITSLFVLAPLAPLIANYVLRRFDTLSLLLPLAALAVPFELPTGTETRLPAVWLLSAAIIGLWMFSNAVRKKLEIARSPLNKPFLAFAITCTISLFWGIAWRDPVLAVSDRFIFVQVASLLTILLSMGAALLIGNYFQTEGRLKYLMLIFIVIGTLMTITQIREIPQGILNDRGLWGTWMVIPAFTLIIAQPKLRWYWRGLLLVLIALTLYQTAIVNADWVSGWVPTIVALLAASLLRSWKLGVSMLLVVGLVGVISASFLQQVAQDNIDDGSLERLSLWEQSWRVISAHWAFGTGPAGYAVYYMTYYRDDARSTHNNYLDILAQFGFIGMGIWLVVAATGIVEGVRLVWQTPPGWLKTVAITATAGWIGAQVSMFFGDWVLPFAYNQGVGGFKYTVYTWLFLGALISVRAILERERRNA